MHIKKYISYFLLFIFIFLFGNLEAQSYDDLRKKYENLKENDEKALSTVSLLIAKAKKEKSNEELMHAYEDAVYYSSKNENKIIYADSTIAIAKKTLNNDLISRSYLGKGIIYYYNLKRYKYALDEYLKAYEYSKKGNDNYQKNKVIYHLGIVKSYLGYYNDALELFNECISYFEPKTIGNYHPNEIYNNSKGYLNSLHLAIVCYIHLGDFEKANFLTNKGLGFIERRGKNEFSLEKSYLLKCKGVLEFQNNDFNKAIQTFNQAIPILESNNDFAWASVVDFYIGKSYISLHNEDVAVAQFKKVDSIFQKHNFILPELRENYELLINYYRKHNDPKQELYYTKVLLKADGILTRDFTYLSSKIHREYDTQNLVDIQNKLENQNKWGLGMIILLCIIVSVLVYNVWKYYQNEKKIKTKYKKLEDNLQHHIEQEPSSVPYENISSQSKSTMSEEVYKDLQDKLEKFEKEKQFLEKGMTLNKLANIFETNSTYLSQFINETKSMNFSRYLGILRINYITQLMYENEKYLNYTIQSLSDECGIASRQNFSDLFQEINGLRPTEFIKKRKKDIEDMKSSTNE
ncbi:helix-turn-helix transcriptional regulator [Elizabethkingia anophelis]|uniref:helix-turn-helix domain-containing protein n=1 Tax=Elizabethkingia TaxID=308865 RepID=UPI0004258938|nr:MULTISPECIES: AraC family transcriptional regulator [Elizabethkingia]KUF45199.1 AraC family transcriptional regulator [Elizabethkingia anophelis]MCT3643971.1 helix-turn-helix transcriptional regulator [Elizabethkingia anophelis]MCT3655138.1 helix-turn-helix transcriptional regulator [Elizabethkingia anophelis]MCT3676854.1 helix-turn-helix transcriptional regulator [Elizabethkingia anophelis]MCT3684289.1 helix-turn-helix transcriptional regulator [Elizabethkingia anophelis]